MAMDEALMPASQFESEEKTEPFPSSEYASRLHSLRVHESYTASDSASSVHLDELVVPSDKDIRLLVRPLRSRSVSPGSSDNCEWMTLRTEVASPDQPHETVLAVTQTAMDIKFTVLLPGERHSEGTPVPPLWCELYYDPSSDNGILVNKCDVPISLSRIYSALSPLASPVGTPTMPGALVKNGTTCPSFAVTSSNLDQETEHTINPGTVRALSPGTWRIRIGRIDVLDFRILERRCTIFKALSPPPSQGHSQNLSGKRTFIADEDDDTGPVTRRQKLTAGAETAAVTTKDKAVVVIVRPTTDPLVVSLPPSAKPQNLDTHANAHVLLNMKSGDSVVMPGSCDMGSYTMTKRDLIASTSQSTVFTGTTDHPRVPPGSSIAVKLFNTPPAPASSPLDRPSEADRLIGPQLLRLQDSWRIVVRQADTWQREYQTHEKLQHESIVRLYAGDARCLSLMMEHVDAKDLSKKKTWRGTTDYFTGDRRDARRILRDISGALNYIHGCQCVHNDVKPANILFSRERGAMLCDFGLSTETKDSHLSLTGGTPYYVPPEFIGRKLRGPPSDVWALGITMLYVLRKIQFPDARGGRHQAKPLYWLIADVNKAPAAAAAPSPGDFNSARAPAVLQMKMWLSEVAEAKEKLNREDEIERMTYEMLSANPAQRITMKKLVSELYSDGSLNETAV
ncbi:hypothetical protein SEPCBS119000_000087 [Sporothrix epigloea]|uniref:Protein kinase domain-containing protein n=1 Tax=Sporothrix epigloea TaxID=1892477 RepID=A0ABP0D473_9PEZI